jgi:hypothetical protein
MLSRQGLSLTVMIAIGDIERIGEEHYEFTVKPLVLHSRPCMFSRPLASRSKDTDWDLKLSCGRARGRIREA